MNSVTASVNTTMVQMTEMSKWPKCLCEKQQPAVAVIWSGLMLNTYDTIFLGHRPKGFWNDRKKYVILVRMFEKTGWKTIIWQVLVQLWGKWPKCFSDQNIAAKNDWSVSAKKTATT